METILNRVKLNFFQTCSSFGVNDFEVLRVLAVFFFFERVAKSVQMYNKINNRFSFYNIRQNQG